MGMLGLCVEQYGGAMVYRDRIRCRIRYYCRLWSRKRSRPIP